MIIEADNSPNETISNGPSTETNIILKQNCTDTDNGDDPKNWGCTYVMGVDTSYDSQHLKGYIACDQVSDGKMIEHYCSGGDIVAKAYSCSIIGEDRYTPHCWETPDSYESTDPHKEETPKTSCTRCDSDESTKMMDSYETYNSDEPEGTMETR